MEANLYSAAPRCTEIRNVYEPETGVVVRWRVPAARMVVLGILATGYILMPGGWLASSAEQPVNGVAWSVAGDAATDGDLSGAACAPDGRCLLVSDEKRRAWFFRLDEVGAGSLRLDVGQRVELTPATGGDEADAEAATFDEGRFYAIGSHGTGRRNRRFQSSRYSVYRIAADGMVQASAGLSEILAGVPGIGEHLCTAAKASAGTCEALQEGGANIEGLAARGGQLYVGFRAPAPGGDAFVARVAEDALFGQADPTTTAFRLRLGRDELGRDLGIRDLAAVSAGFLVLAGPSLPEGDDAVSSGVVFYWDGGSGDPRRLREVGKRESGAKPEVLLVLGESASDYRVIVMHDGIPGGAPVEYRIPK